MCPGVVAVPRGVYVVLDVCKFPRIGNGVPDSWGGLVVLICGARGVGSSGAGLRSFVVAVLLGFLYLFCRIFLLEFLSVFFSKIRNLNFFHKFGCTSQFGCARMPRERLCPRRARMARCSPYHHLKIIYESPDVIHTHRT